MWDLVGNPEDQFSHKEAHMCILKYCYYLNINTNKIMSINTVVSS